MERVSYRLRCPVRRRKNARGVLRIGAEQGRGRGWRSCFALGAFRAGDHGRDSGWTV